MKLFLTSRLLLEAEQRLNPMNGFVETLRPFLQFGMELVYISADPTQYAYNDQALSRIVSAFLLEDVIFKKSIVLDERNAAWSEELCSGSNKIIILAKGDVFSQNIFFRKISLKNVLKKFEGIVIAEGGGAMNCAGVLYVMPRTVEQAYSATFMKFLPGLGLTSRAIIPHYERVRQRTVGQLRYLEDVILSDSSGKSFFALPDGSFIYYNDGAETIRGTIWHIHDGEIQEIPSSLSL